MAGSYNHATMRRGYFRDNDSFVQMIENLGDAYEMAEEMYGMIWQLAGQLDDPVAKVELARQDYLEGLRVARDLLGSADDG